MLTEHVSNQSSAFLYYGSRTAVPARIRVFIDLALERLGDSPEYVLGEKDLQDAEKRGRHIRS